MTARIGDNKPPDPIDDCLTPYGDAIIEAEAWLDGKLVEDDSQMKAVDDLTKEIKSALKAATAGQKSEAAPIYDAWKSALARWKPTLDDLKRLRDGLIAIVGPYKQAKAKAALAATQAAWAEANKARLEAETKAVNAGNIEAQREAAAAAQRAIDTEKAAKSAKAERPKGLRKTPHYEVMDVRAAINWIARNDKPAIAAFVDEYARTHQRGPRIDGVKNWITEEAY